MNNITLFGSNGIWYHLHFSLCSTMQVTNNV